MTERLTHCVGCKREMRPQEIAAADRPGTVRRATKTTCGTCYERQKRNGTMEPIGRDVYGWGDCHNCERPMRPATVKLDDHPGTIAHGKHGYCTSCASRKRKTGSYGDRKQQTPVTLSDPTPTIDPEAPHADTLLGYYRARERRLARAERIAKFRAKYGVAA